MTYLILIALLIAACWYAGSERRRANNERFLSGKAIDEAARQAVRADRYREALETSYVGLQAMSEKLLEAQWIRDDGHIVTPGIWVGDEFIEVEAAEKGDLEVGQPVGGSNTIPLDLARNSALREAAARKLGVVFDPGPAGEAAEFGGTIPLSTEDTK